MTAVLVAAALCVGATGGSLVTHRHHIRRIDRHNYDTIRLEVKRENELHRQAQEGWARARQWRAALLAHEDITRDLIGDLLDKASARHMAPARNRYREFLARYGHRQVTA